MSVRQLSPLNVAAAAVLIGGAVVLVVPWHAPSVARLVVLTLAAAVVLHAVATLVPEWTGTGWSPFGRRARLEDDAPRSRDLERIRARLSGRRQTLGEGRWVPPETLRLLQPLVRGVLEREGRGSPPSPLTRAVLAVDPLPLSGWLGTRRRDPQRVAEIVHDVMDDLDRLSGAPAPDGTRRRRGTLRPGDAT